MSQYTFNLGSYTATIHRYLEGYLATINYNNPRSMELRVKLCQLDYKGYSAEFVWMQTSDYSSPSRDETFKGRESAKTRGSTIHLS